MSLASPTFEGTPRWSAFLRHLPIFRIQKDYLWLEL
jgi:hypothetical protein